MTLLFNRREVGCLLAGASIAPVIATCAQAAQSIDQSDYVKLGGIEQWISIKGEDTANPVLLMVHGGPADVQWPNADKYVPWQKDFTLVQWDQRGAGHTYGHSGGDKTPGVNLDRDPLVWDKAPPMLGEDTVDVLRELGRSDDVIAGLAADGLIRVADLDGPPTEH